MTVSINVVKSHVYRYSTDGTIFRALLKFTEGYDNNSNRAGRIAPESLAGKNRRFHVTYSISWDITLMAPILVQFEDGTNQFNAIDFTQLPNCYPCDGLPVDYEQLNRIENITAESVPKPFDDSSITNLLLKQTTVASSIGLFEYTNQAKPQETISIVSSEYSDRNR